MQPLLGPESRATLIESLLVAEGEAGLAAVRADAARVALHRAERLERDKAGSVRSVDEARAQLDLADASRKTAEARRDFLAKVIDVENGAAARLPIESPIDGLIRAIQAAPGQTVAAGDALFDVQNLDKLWIRVPVYAGDLGRVLVDHPALWSLLGDESGMNRRPANPVAAPPAASADAATVDLFYEVNNNDGTLQPGQRLSVLLQFGDPQPSLVVPWSSVIHDALGGTWVYEKIADHKFRRRRIQVWYVGGSGAVLANGPPPGAKVVTTGAAELFGVEFGIGK